MDFSSHVMCCNTCSLQRCELLVKQIVPPVWDDTPVCLFRNVPFEEMSRFVLEPVPSFKSSLLASTQAAILCSWLTFRVTPPHFCRGVNNSAGVTHEKKDFSQRCAADHNRSGNCGLLRGSDCVTVYFCWSALIYRALILNLNSARGSLSQARSSLTS